MTLFDKVKEFHEKYGFPINVAPNISSIPAGDLAVMHGIYNTVKLEIEMLRRLAGNSVAAQRLYLIGEEYCELMLGFINLDLTEIADAVADLDYVVTGTSVALGFPHDALLDTVHSSNMTKDIDGKLKPTKGDNFEPPHIREILTEMGFFV